MNMLEQMILDQTIICKALTWLQLTVTQPNDFIKKEELDELDNVLKKEMTKLNMLERENKNG